MVYTITVQQDMRQMLCFDADNITEALKQAQEVFKESMVTGDDNGEQRARPLSTIPQSINPPKLTRREEQELDEIVDGYEYPGEVQL